MGAEEKSKPPRKRTSRSKKNDVATPQPETKKPRTPSLGKRKGTADSDRAAAEPPQGKEDATHYLPKDYEETSLKDATACLSRAGLQDSQLWLIQVPSEMAEVDALAAAEWTLAPDPVESGRIGVITWPTGEECELRAEKEKLVREIAVLASDGETLPIKRALIIHRNTPDEKPPAVSRENPGNESRTKVN